MEAETSWITIVFQQINHLLPVYSNAIYQSVSLMDEEKITTFRRSYNFDPAALRLMYMVEEMQGF